MTTKIGWLCLNPENLVIEGIILEKPDDVLAYLSVYASIEAAKKIHGSNAVTMKVEVDVADEIAYPFGEDS